VSLRGFLRQVVQVLDDADVPYMLTGSVAAAYYASPRATQDIDVVIDTREDGIQRVVQGFLDAGCYVDRDAALEAWRTHGQFNAIHPESGWKVDLIVRKERSFSRTEFERRERASILGVEVSLATMEDILIAKLEWSRLGDSELQRSDVVQLIERSRDQFDRAYVERWISTLGLESEWKTVLRRLERT